MTGWCWCHSRVAGFCESGAERCRGWVLSLSHRTRRHSVRVALGDAAPARGRPLVASGMSWPQLHRMQGGHVTRGDLSAPEPCHERGNPAAPRRELQELPSSGGDRGRAGLSSCWGLLFPFPAPLHARTPPLLPQNTRVLPSVTAL